MGLILKKWLCPALALLLLAADSYAASHSKTRVILSTEMGTIVLELFPDKAPLTVAHFVENVNRYHYDGLIFHRVVKGFVIQSGRYNYDLYGKEPGDTVPNESGNGLKNLRGTIAMARTADPDSASDQFYINLRNNRNLDPQGKRPGYTVFGRVIEGMDVVDLISKVPVIREDIFSHLPVEPIRILSARVTKQP